jgi:hypothetical protein
LETIDAIDADYYARINRAKRLRKLIILPLSDDGSMHLGFTLDEFDELKAVVRDYITQSSCPVCKIGKFDFKAHSLSLN